jgi:diguanylate cyclase (GGDEF)-like protein
VNHKPMILAIDDTPVNLKTLVAVLVDEYELQIATSGEEGLLYASNSVPDLILLDIMMPSMDGYEICRRLKADPKLKDVPVVFITALSEAEAEATGLDLGAVDFLTKPINVPIARKRIHNHLEREHLRKVVEAQRDALEQLARTDSLTGLTNRRYFLELADREIKRAIRQGDGFSLLMIDIDHFKNINDTYGHHCGDLALQHFAGLCKSTLRSIDVFGRLGGEEFAAFLPSADAANAREVAERLRWTAESNELLLSAGEPLRFTVSVGIVTVPQARVRSGITVDSLVEQADQEMYRAKNGGRNQVCAREILSDVDNVYRLRVGPFAAHVVSPAPSALKAWTEKVL